MSRSFLGSSGYYIATVLYPEAFGDVDPVEKTNEIVRMFLGADDYYDALQEAGYEFKQLTLGWGPARATMRSWMPCWRRWV